MFESTEIEFTLDGVEGTFVLEYKFIGQPKLYQNGQLLTNKGTFRLKYDIQTGRPEQPTEEIEIRKGLSLSYSVIHQGKRVFVEKKLSVGDIILSLLPMLQLTIINGVFGVLIAVLASRIILGFVRGEESTMMKIVAAFLITFLAALLCILVAMMTRSRYGY